jgi:hypothetical protein
VAACNQEQVHPGGDGSDRVYWKPVWNILSDGMFELILANAAHIKNVQFATMPPMFPVITSYFTELPVAAFSDELALDYFNQEPLVHTWSYGIH